MTEKKINSREGTGVRGQKAVVGFGCISFEMLVNILIKDSKPAAAEYLSEALKISQARDIFRELPAKRS